MAVYAKVFTFPSRPFRALPASRHQKRRFSRPLRRVLASETDFQLGTEAAEDLFLSEVARLGFPASVLPGAGQERERVDALVSALEASPPVPVPLGGNGAAPSPLLFGSWKLIYASNGTVVTRTALVQALVAASLLPGVGLRDIQQDLLSTSEGIKTTNSLVFGLFVLGEWNATIYGSWRVESNTLAQVAFEAYSVQLVGAFGWRPLRQEFFKLKIPLPEAARQRAADFETTYLSQQLRIARGSTGNVFVFSRKVKKS